MIAPPFYSRQDWGSVRAPREDLRDPGAEAHVVIHHSGDQHCKAGDSLAREMEVVRQHEAFHIGPERGWAAIGYNFLVSPNGHIFEGRGWPFKGAHAGQINGDSIGVCLLMDGRLEDPTPAQVAAVKWLIADGVSRGELRTDYLVSGHRDHRQTTCPGDRVYRMLDVWRR